MADRDTQLLLNELKDRLGISQEELAKRIGVTFATVNRWLNGKSIPRGKSMAAIMKLVEAEGLEVKEGTGGATTTGRRGVRRRLNRLHAKTQFLADGSAER